MTLAQLLIEDEGVELKPYKDIFGNWTIGIGRNLDDVGLSQEEAIYLLNNDIHRARCAAMTFWWFDSLDSVRQDVVISMIFNMGLTKFLLFQRMIAALEQNDYQRASIEMLQSAWERQVGDRAHRLAAMMASGKYPEVKH